jgi:hypothetical protein
VAAHHGLAPLRRAAGRGAVGQHGEAAIVEQCGRDDADFVIAARRIDV